MKKITVTCKCPKCGADVPINKKDAALVLRANRKDLSKEQYSKAGKAGAAKRWGIKI